MSGLRAAIFDLDGLLVDSEPLWHQAELQVFTALGVPLTEELVRTTKGRFVGEVARHWHERFGWQGPSPDDVAARIVDVVGGLLAEHGHLKAGAAGAVAACRRRGLRLAVASSSPRRLIATTLDRHQLAGCFDVVHSAEDEAQGKPHPDVFLTTASLLGVDAATCVVFEDSPAGVAAAHAAGMVCVAVPEGPAGDGFASAAVVLPSLAALDGDTWATLEQAASKPASGQTADQHLGVVGEVDGDV